MRQISLALAAVALSCASALSQETKTLLLDRPMGNDPIRVTHIMVGTTELKSDRKHFPNHYAWETTFNADDDWIKNLSLTVKNVSNQTITHLQVVCGLFETSDWAKELATHNTPANPVLGQAHNTVGWRPEHALYSVRTGRASAPDSTRRPAFELAPGGEFTILLEDPEDYASLKSAVEARQPISTIRACDADVATIFLADGTKWASHRYWRPTEQPGRYEILPESEAPQVNAEATK